LKEEVYLRRGGEGSPKVDALGTQTRVRLARLIAVCSQDNYALSTLLKRKGGHRSRRRNVNRRPLWEREGVNSTKKRKRVADQRPISERKKES
jgi:hypothetical protein